MILFALTLAAILGILIAMFTITKIERLNKDFIRFILTGGLNTFNYYLMYLILFDIIGFEYLVAHITAFLYSAFVSFFFTTMYTFGERPTLKRFILFPITFLPNLIISTFGTLALVNSGLVSETFASLIAMCLAIPITFLIAKLVLTNKESE